MFLIKHQY